MDLSYLALSSWTYLTAPFGVLYTWFYVLFVKIIDTTSDLYGLAQSLGSLLVPKVTEITYAMYRFLTDVTFRTLGGFISSICVLYLAIIITNAAGFGNGEDTNCLVCRERKKCMLYVPCKHVCLCYECNLLLTNHDGGCPICRSPVRKSVRIYL